MAENRRTWASQHRYVLIGLALVTLFMVMFVVAEQMRIPLLTNPRAHVVQATWPAAAIGVSLLVADVVLPIPASGVMIAQGAAFGFLYGSMLSLVGGTGATLVAYFVGRRSRGLLNRVVPHDQQRRGAELLERHGMWAIVVTRPVPMLAETIGILAGTTSMPWWKVAAAGAIGNLVPAVAYAAAGAYAATFVNGLAVFAGVLALALLTWVLQGQSAHLHSKHH
jgi:uncharacterized membrane protein YdjX (TVP38/TMEM64 family)